MIFRLGSRPKAQVLHRREKARRPSADLVRFSGAVSAAVLAAVAADAAQAQPAALLPQPALEQAAAGAFQLSARTLIVVPPGDAGARAAAQYLADLLARSRGLRLRVVEGAPAAGAVTFRRTGPKGEAYALDAAPGALTIAASDDAGLFYGAVTAWQLATAEPGRGAAAIDGVHIEDAPRYAWRGLMLDSARHFQSPAFVKGLIDRMARAKLNVLHWHLTDDQGWRLEIKKYPRLTEVGAWRVPAGAGPAADIDPKTGQPRKYGGYYTQDQVREIVAYAAARHITIVPEIEMPGHATAAIAAYPQLGSAAQEPTAPTSSWGVFDNLYNVDESTFAFLQDVLDEVMALFPSTYIHLGGDEAIKPQWKANPKVQARMRELHIPNEDALQGWFTARMEQYLNQHGRKLIGWDEILQGGVAPGATVMSWRGADGALIAAKMGHDTVLAPAPTFYFDNRQGASPDEPSGRGLIISLKQVYDYDPVPAALTPAEQKHVLGVQAQVWTEHVTSEERTAKMFFPRALALAETGWTPAARRGWSSFTDRLPAELDRERALGAVFDDAALQPHVLAEPVSGGAAVKLYGAEELGETRHALGKAPLSTGSMNFTAPVPSQVLAQAFAGGRPLADPSVTALTPLSIRTRSSQELELCTQGIALNLEDDAPATGPRARFLVDVMNPCWIWRGADLTGVRALSASVGQLPFNFSIGEAIDKVVRRPPSTAEGELVVRRDGCTGPVIATLPLAPATRSQATTTLRGPIQAADGKHDLCLTFTSTKIDPFWALDRVSLAPPGTAP